MSPTTSSARRPLSDDTLRQTLLHAWERHQQGHLADAEQGYRAVLDADPRHVHALNLLGVLCIGSGRAAEAATLIQAALQEDDEDAEPHANLALALKDLGRLDEAAQALERSLARSPHNPVALNNLGNVHAERQRLDEAVSCFRAALRVDPDHGPALVNLSAALLARGQWVGAQAAAERARELDPMGAAPNSALGDLWLKRGRHDAAATCFRQALRADPGHADARLGLSAALKELGEVQAAEDLLRQQVAEAPGHAAAWNSLGVLFEQRGDKEGAAAAFRRALAASPRYANAYYQLAQLESEALREPELQALRALYREPGLHDGLRAPLAFALACVHERAGEHPRALEYLHVGQAIKARENPYDDERVLEYHRRLASAFPDSLAAPDAPCAATAAGPQPLFVLGMPRSGTSLAEQVLACHPQVAGAGEMSLMEDTVNEASRRAGLPFPECMARLDAAALSRLGDHYRSRLLARASAARWVVDKTPMNFQYVGLIARLLPHARIVYCVREPMDNCLSIYKLPFESEHAYAHDLRSLGRYWRHHESLMAHWAAVVPGRLLTLRYEDMVADLGAQVQRLVEFLGLPPEQEMLHFHRTRRLVKTPSASQVRRPLYGSSVQLWRRYGEGLAPLAEALGASSAGPP